MSRSYYHRRHRKPEKTPPYWIRMHHTKPERRAVNTNLKEVVKGADPDSLSFDIKELTLLDYWL